jgi:hypothetical protein
MPSYIEFQDEESKKAQKQNIKIGRAFLKALSNYLVKYDPYQYPPSLECAEDHLVIFTLLNLTN